MGKWAEHPKSEQVLYMVTVEDKKRIKAEAARQRLTVSELNRKVMLLHLEEQTGHHDLWGRVGE